MISQIYNSLIPLYEIGSRKGKSKFFLEKDYNEKLNKKKSNISNSKKTYKSKLQTLDLNSQKLKKWKKKRKIK